MTLIGGRLGDFKAKAKRAVEAFEEGRSRLLRPDGSRLFSDGEHEERMRALKRERNAVLSEVEEEARSIIEGAGVEVANLENRDPADLLTPGELVLANRRRAFALDAAETLGTEALVARLESVLAGGEKGSIFAHWVAGQRRLAKASLGSPQGAREGALDGVLEKMLEALDGGRTAAQTEEVRRRVEAAREVHQFAYLARRDQRSVYEPSYAVPGPGAAGRGAVGAA